MLGFSSEMIGLPPRRPAREIYDRIVKARGTHSVALIAGEEEIVPLAPRYFVRAVEAAPLDRAVEFLAIDENQLRADRDPPLLERSRGARRRASMAARRQI